MFKVSQIIIETLDSIGKGLGIAGIVIILLASNISGDSVVLRLIALILARDNLKLFLLILLAYFIGWGIWKLNKYNRFTASVIMLITAFIIFIVFRASHIESDHIVYSIMFLYIGGLLSLIANLLKHRQTKEKI